MSQIQIPKLVKKDSRDPISMAELQRRIDRLDKQIKTAERKKKKSK